MLYHIVCVGRVKESYIKGGLDEFTKRLSVYGGVSVSEVSEEKCPENLSEKEKVAVLEKEGREILSRVPSSGTVITLEIEGKKLDSVSFSRFLQEKMVSGKTPLIFIIGGSLGLSDEVKKKSHLSLSLSSMTFPHQLTRLILLEQIYRAVRIQRGEPYHK